MDHSNHTLLSAGSQTAVSDRMRELLARAAQDHVYEQRTQGAVLDEIRQRLEGMEWLLREVRERELGGLNGTLEVLTGRIDTFGGRIDAVGDRVRPVAELPGLWADLGTVGESVEEALERLQVLLDGTRGLAVGLGEFTRRVDRLQSGMEAAAGRFGRIDKALAELAQHTTRVEGCLRELSEKLTADVDRLGGRLDDRFEEINERLDTVDDHIEAVNQRVGQLPVTLDLADMRTRILDTVSTLGDSQGTGFDTVGERLNTMDGRLESVDGRLSEAASAMTPLMEAIHARPDREEITEAVTRRLGALEETMLALAEALLRPARGGKE